MEGIMGWRVVYAISRERHSTKKGHGHLSEHAFDTLTERMEQDDETMTRALMKAAFEWK